MMMAAERSDTEQRSKKQMTRVVPNVVFLNRGVNSSSGSKGSSNGRKDKQVVGNS